MLADVGWVGAIAQTHQNTALIDGFHCARKSVLQSTYPTQNIKLIITSCLALEIGKLFHAIS